MGDLHYNYVYFNANYELRSGLLCPDEFNAVCLRDAEGMEGVQVIQCQLQYSSRFIRRVELRHEKWAEKYHFPFKNLWYPFFFKPGFKEDKPYCFIVASRWLPIDYVRYLKRKYPDCRLVRLYRDLMRVEMEIKGYSEEEAARLYDLRFSYDPEEAEAYSIEQLTGPASKIEVLRTDKALCDVFFCGSAKKRLPKIVEAYDRLSEAGLECHFIVAFSEPSERVERPGIEYRDTYLNYTDILHWTVNSRCLLEINQDGASGVTPRFLEAVMYDRLLITDNEKVRSSKYYDPKYIHVVSGMSEINPGFVKGAEKADFKYSGEFSPVELINRIDRLLCARN